MNIDISLLKEKPELTEKVTLRITPLAPLSMVSEMPGAFYKTMRLPDKRMLCGLMENALGWHLSWTDRENILNHSRKQRGLGKVKTEDRSSYVPLLIDYFEINDKVRIENLRSICFYKDLWSRGFRRKDSLQKHINGCRNISIDVLAEYHVLFNEGKKETEGKKGNEEAEKKKEKEEADLKRKEWCKENQDKVPMYYTTPTEREFMSLDGEFMVETLMDKRLLQLLLESLPTRNVGYLGTSEGWVDIEII